MTTERTINGILPKNYWEKKSSQGRILDQPELGLLEFYPAGFTQSNESGESRQKGHRILYGAAVSTSKECWLFPFEDDAHKVLLIPEPSNPHDPHAIKVICEGSGGVLAGLSLDLGYVPARINKFLHAAEDLINGGRVLKVQAGVHQKYWRAKVILAYNHASFESLLEEEMERFARLVED
jgi:hypothetical protein